MSEEILTHTPVDRSGWPSGEWDTEPDRVEFEYAGFPCLVKRNHSGAWCGYVAVPPGHIYHGADYNDVAVEVHGGLTYGDLCSGDICHIPKHGEPDDVFWLGFDCAHGGDRVPAMEKYGFHLLYGATYKTMTYARQEVEHLAEQLAHARATT